MSDTTWVDDLHYDHENEWDDDDWKLDDLHPVREEPDHGCWTCEDSGLVQGAHREVNCPECRPTPRQRRRTALRDAWWARKWSREAVRRADGLIDLGAPF